MGVVLENKNIVTPNLPKGVYIVVITQNKNTSTHKLTTMKTINYTLITLLLLTASSCLKVKQRKKVKVNVSVLNPITKEGDSHSGIPIKILEKTNKKYKADEYKTLCESVTNSEGKATVEFYRPMNHKKWRYDVYMEFDESGYNPNQYSDTYISSIAKEKTNDILFYIGEKVSLPIHIKNLNCFDANDKALFEIERGIYINSFLKNNSYIPNDFYGCHDEIIDYVCVEDYYPYTLTVTRNGQTTVVKDTFVVTKDTDTLKWYY